MPKRNHDSGGRHAQARAQVADAAARLMLEHGIRDYGLAKRKAARQLGLPEGFGLPSNEEVDEAAIHRRSLFEPEEHLALLAQLREQALEVMLIFERFSPILTGALATGAVSEHSLIELDIHADTSKDFEQFLINREIEHKVQDRGSQMAYLIYAQPADVLVRLIGQEGRHGHKPQISLRQLRQWVEDNRPGHASAGRLAP